MNRDRDKFSQRSRSCIFVGYPFGKKGWKVYDVERNEFLVYRDVVFQEDVFPFANSKIAQPAVSPSDVVLDEDWAVGLDDRGSSPTSPTTDTIEQNVANVEENATGFSETETETVDTEHQPVVDLDSSQVSASSENLGRGRREKTQSV
uniref:Retroviral polymerase SH3-like domain-containing protein n=1 Tax=Brassica oleracea var. oleracea TaxID=109376 RepID=A0A0D3BIV7_BRAOL